MKRISIYFVIFLLLFVTSCTTKKDLSNEIQNQKAEFNQQIKDLNDQLSQLSETTSQSDDYLKQKIDETIQDYSNKINLLNSEYDKKIAELVAKDEEARQSISSLNAELNQKIESAKSDYNSKITNFRNEYNEKIAELVENDDEILETISELDSELNQKITNANSEYQSQINKLKTDYNEIIDDLESEIENISSEINSLNTSLNQKITTSKNELSAKIDAFKLVYDDKIEEIESLVASYSETISFIDSLFVNYNVTLVFNNGDDDLNITVKNLNCINKPDDPTKEGYVFVGWVDENDVLWRFNMDQVTNDITLYAKYVLNQFSVSLNRNDVNAGTVSGAKTYIYNQQVTIVATLNPGYTFMGWFDENTIVSNDLTYTFNMPAKDLTLTAKYQADDDTVYKINYYLENAEDDNYTLFETESKEGITNTTILLLPKEYLNFVTPEMQQLKILGDGSSEISFYYSRNRYSINLNNSDTDGGTISGEGIYKYQQSVVLSAIINAGYTFNGWYSNNKLVSVDSIYSFNMPNNNLDLTANTTANNNTKYIVEHYLENTDNDEYTLYDVDNLTGTTNTYTKASVKSIDEFIAPSIDQVLIDGNGNTVIKVYYQRNTYPLILSNSRPECGTITESSNKKYNQQITIVAVANDGYSFMGWFDDDNLVSDLSSYTFNMPNHEMGLIAKWSNNTDTPYKVEHYKQNAENDEYILCETSNLTGTTEGETNATTNIYVGFSANSFSQTTIKGDGTTIVKIYYNRAKFVLSLNKIDSLGGTVQGSDMYKHGETFTAKAVLNPGYTFIGWFDNADNLVSEEKEYVSVMPLSSVILTAKWEANNDTKYRVAHYLENSDDDSFVLVGLDELSGKTNNLTNALANIYSGFVAPVVQQKAINGDGSTIVEIYYYREVHSLNIQISDPLGATFNGSGSYKNEQFVTITALINVGYTFVGWYDGETFKSANLDYIFNMPNKDLDLTLKVVANTNTKYTVEHYKQNINESKYTLFETEQLSGTTNVLTNASAKTYEGFTNQTIIQQMIRGDGTTVIKVYYDRNKYSVTLNKNIDEGGVIVGSKTYSFGQNVKVQASANLGYSFIGWYLDDILIEDRFEYTFVMPDNVLNLEARFELCLYEVRIIKNIDDTFIIEGADYYHYQDQVLLDAYNISSNRTIKWTTSDGITHIGDKYYFTMNNYDLEIEVCETLPYERDGDIIYFGSYPQTLVTDNNIKNMLLEKVGTYDGGNWNVLLPTWSDDSAIDFMFFIDLDVNGDGQNDYRGLYFTDYRDKYSTNVFAHESTALQYVHDYYCNTYYWFKYEPIEWKIIEEQDGKVFIYSTENVDGGRFRVTPTQVTYKDSPIRSFINSMFYDTAFNSLQQNIIETTTIDGKLYDKLFLLSQQETDNEMITGTTDYTWAMGIDGGYSFYVRDVSGGSDSSVVLYIHENQVGVNYVKPTCYYGIKPACWIVL